MTLRQGPGTEVVQRDGILRVALGSVLVVKKGGERTVVNEDEDCSVEIGDKVYWQFECDYDIEPTV